MKTRAFIGLGSNVGDRAGFLQMAVNALHDLPTNRVVRVSSVYETEPVGDVSQPWFLNAVVEVETSLGIPQLYETIRRIERDVGRRSRQKWGPREIDLDILYYGSTSWKDESLEVPHPQIVHRRFVLVPVCELDEEFVDPARGTSVKTLLGETADRCKVVRTSSTLSIPEGVV